MVNFPHAMKVEVQFHSLLSPALGGERLTSQPSRFNHVKSAVRLNRRLGGSHSRSQLSEIRRFFDYEVPELDGASTFITEVKYRGKWFFRNTENHLAAKITWCHKSENRNVITNFVEISSKFSAYMCLGYVSHRKDVYKIGYKFLYTL